MLNKRKSLMKLCAALPAALLLMTTPVLADETDQTSSQSQTTETNKQTITYQSLYWRCVNQYTGQTLQVMYADTVKVVNGVPERQFFHMGTLPERIGDFEIAGNRPYGARPLEVDPNNPSGVTYVDCVYYLPGKKNNTASVTKKRPNTKHHSQNVVKNNHKNHVVNNHANKHSTTTGLTDKKQTATSKTNDKKVKKAVKNKKKSKTPVSNDKAKVQADAANRNSNIFKFIVTPLIIIVIALIFIPHKLGPRKRSKHAK